jgi:hypothetical protein
VTNETKFSIETTISITHFTSEEFRKYREEHEDENGNTMWGDCNEDFLSTIVIE